MAFKNYKNGNNAETTAKVGFWSLATTIILNDWEWDLFPASNFIITAEKFNAADQVIKREIIEITSRTGDVLTISARWFEACVQDETQNPKTLTSNALEFDSGDKISQYLTNLDVLDTKTEIVRLENDKLDISTYEAARIAFAATSTWNDDYAITVSWDTSYVNWKTYKVQADVNNTWTATLNINWLWAKTLKKLLDAAFTDLSTDDIIANQIFFATYNQPEDCFQFSVDPAQVVVPWSSSTQSTVTAWEDISAWEYVWYDANAVWYFKTDASDINKINFFWVASETATSWNPIKLDTSWVTWNQTFSAGDIWKDLYLADTLLGSTTSWAIVTHPFWYTTVNFEKAAQKFTTTTDLTMNDINLWLRKNWTPTWDIYIRIETDSSWDASWTLIDPNAVVTIDWASLTTTTTKYTKSFTSFTLPAWTYHLVFASQNLQWWSWNYYDTWRATPIWWIADSVFRQFENGSWSNWNAWYNLTFEFVFPAWQVSTTPWTNSKKCWKIFSTTEALINTFW